MKSSFEFHPALHGFRCIAAMAVFFFHWGLYFPGGMQWMAQFHVPGHPWVNLSLPFALGSEGVTLFFVLSSYLLTSQWMQRSVTWVSILSFYRRRAIRIYPAFLVQLAILLYVGYWLPLAFPPYSFKDIALTGLMWINLPPFYVAPMNDVWWTLPVEMAFYIVLPGLLLLTRKCGLTLACIAVASVTLLWRAGVMHNYDGELLSSHLAVLDALPGVLSVFMAGAAMALLQERMKKYEKEILLISILLFVMLQAVLISEIEVYWKGGLLLLVWNTLLSISFAMAVGAICMRTAPPNWLGSKYMVWMGDMSFGIYLWHFPFILIIHNYWPAVGKNSFSSFLILLVLLFCTLSMAALSFYLIERPIMSRSKRMS